MLNALQYLLAGVAFGSAGGLTPGPTLTLVVAQTLRHGLREGLKVAVAPLLTDAPIVLLAIWVLHRIDARPVLGSVALAGAAVLAYLAWESFNARPPALDRHGTAPASLRKGFLANFLNPHPWVFWLTIGGPTLLRALDEGAASAGAFLAGQYGCLIGAKMLIAVLVDRGRSRLGRGYTLVMKLLGLVLAVFALVFLREAIGYLR